MPDDTRIALARLRDIINADPDRFTNSYFARLFALDPSVRDLFPSSLGHVRGGFTASSTTFSRSPPHPPGTPRPWSSSPSSAATTANTG